MGSQAAAVSPLAPKEMPDLPAIEGARFATAAAGIRYKGRTDVLLALFDPSSDAPEVPDARSPDAGHGATERGERVSSATYWSGLPSVLPLAGDDLTTELAEKAVRGCHAVRAQA